jgi:prolyl oligopeptidase
MKKIAPFLLITAMIISASCNQSKFHYPETRKDSVVNNYFGTKVPDPYRWLENDTSEETKKWVIAQNELTFSYLKSIPCREQIIKRLTDIFNYEKYSAPFKQGNRYFFYKNNGLQNQSVLYMLDKLEGEPKELLDPNTLSKEGTTSLATAEVSKDAKYLAYAVSVGGSDWNEIYVKNIETGKQLDDHIKWVKFSGISWYKDGFYYSRYPEPKENQKLTTANKNSKVYYHKIGTSQKEDVLVYENPKQPDRMYGGYATQDGAYLILTESETTTGNGLYFKDLNKEGSAFVKIAEGFRYDYSVVDHVNGKLLVLTNENAPRYKLMAVDPANPSKRIDLIPERNEVLTGCDVGGGKIAATYMKDAYSKVYLFSFDGKPLDELKLPGIGSFGGFSSRKDDNVGFYTYSSFTSPPTIYKYDFSSGKSEIYREPIIKGIDFTQYTTEQVFFNSKDGTKVPMFIVHKNGIKLDGYNPTLLYGYGGFNISLTPSFSILRMLWLENGGIYVSVNLRGGGEYGEDWHKAGTLENKQNVFDDFIGAAEFLIANKYTTPARLAIEGGSNGGLLIGAVTNQRPELFKVALPHVGVLDMLRYQYFTIGRAWSSDYGLSEDSLMFPVLYKYSPLHNVKEKTEYPAIMVLTGDHDDRVVPAHSFKYAATLQEKYKGPNPVIIRIETMAGHGAGKPTSKRIEEAADIWSFIYDNMEINPY